jgi:alanyl-tRNA synthetase
MKRIQISGADVFKLADITLPIELTKEVRKAGFAVDMDGFEKEMRNTTGAPRMSM